MTISLKPRLRMAPSPTGFMHLGTLRTVLFSYLLAKKWQGTLILRIEDTDQKREVEGAADNLLKVFSDFDISFDEGPGIGGSVGPYIQSERLDLYKKYAEDLVARGEAYYCFATPEELEKLREEQAARKEAPRYDRRFRDYPLEEAKKRIANGDTFVIRHKIPLEGKVIVTDELRGEISFNAEDIDDYVLLKSDGFPTYQLASVVDDHLMSITHVTRGDEWIPSLPKNILLYKSFNWEAPKFLHFPLILNKNGGKLSKRQGDVFAEDFLQKGYLKEALLNFCALLGWHPKNDQEIFSLDELEKTFDTNGISVSPAVFDQEKLDFYNGYYIKKLSSDELLRHAKPFLLENLAKAVAQKQTDEFIKSVLALEQPRLKVLSELKESTSFFFEEKLEYDPALLVWKKITAQETKANLETLLEKLSQFNEAEWNTIELEKNVVDWLRAENKQLGDFLWPMRVALSGRKASPGPFEIALVLGKDETLDKIKQATGKLT
jgi:glutamyl-tRNA synthetase